MQRYILFLFLLPLSVLSQKWVWHAKDKQYEIERAPVAQKLNSCFDSREQLRCIDSLLTQNLIANPRLQAELWNKKAEILSESTATYLDSLFATTGDFSTNKNYKDSLLQVMLKPVQTAWKKAESLYLSPEYEIKNYEILLRYSEGSEKEKTMRDALKEKGYRKKFSATLFSAGIRANDKNAWFFAEGSLIRNEIQPGYRIKTEKVVLRHAGKFTETCVLTAEIKNTDTYGFSFSPARVTSFFFADPIRIGLKTSSEGNGFRWFIRPSLGISYRFFSLGYSVNVYFRKSDAIANDLHYVNFRASIPLFKAD